MILMLSGEGKTDMGQMNATETTGSGFVPGPMARVVDRVAESELGYSVLDTDAAGADCVRFVGKADLAAQGKSGPMQLSGIKYGKETAFFTRNAQVLGILARAERKASGQPVVAVLFRDADSTRSTPYREWHAKVSSIERGFALVGFDRGVAMVPRPKSEAWLLCALKPDAYQHCAALEDASGNDNSPHSLKRQLEALVGHEPTADEQADWIATGKIDPNRIDMPSFTLFREGLKRALSAV